MNLIYLFFKSLLVFNKESFSKLKVKVKVTQSCLILCDPMDYTVHGIL